MAGLLTPQLQMPVANEEIAKRKRAAADMQIARAMRQGLQPGQTISEAARGLGATAQAAQGQIGLETQQQQQTQAAAMAQDALKQREIDTQMGFKQQEIDLDRKANQLRNTLASLGEAAADEELKDRDDFVRYRGQQEYLSDRVLSDYAVRHAVSVEQFKDYAQTAQQASDRKLQIIETAFKLEQQRLEQEYQKASKDKKQELQKELTEMKRQAELAMQREKNKAANRLAQWKAVGSVVFAVAGGITGAVLAGPAGAAAGAMSGAKMGAEIGGGLGTVAATL